MNMLLIFLLALNAHGATTEQIKNLKYSMTVKDAKSVSFSLASGHHFNGEAPSRVLVKMNGKETLAKTEVTPQQVTSVFEKDFTKDCQITAELYVCDDANTYCVPKKQVFSCKGKLVAEPTGLVKTSEAIKEARNYFVEDLFLEKAEDAFAQAKKEHKLVLIDFFGIWCPPCNMLDETVFSTALFQKQKKNFVFLKLDADKPESWDLKSKYNVKGYPTIMLVNAQGEEIHRIVGSRRAKAFVAEMMKAVKSRNTPMSVKQKLADGEGHPVQAYELGMIHLNREEFGLAYYYMLKASRTWPKESSKHNDLLSAQLGVQSQLTGVENRKILAKLYEGAIKWFPHKVEVFDRLSKLSDLAEELNDEKLKEWTTKQSVEVGQWFLKNPKVLANVEMTSADIYSFIAASFAELKNEAQSRAYYKKAYNEYTRTLKRSLLNEKTERGVNLERIYCLWKSGEPEKAQVLYSELEKAYPNEFTFYYQHAHLLKDMKKFDQALEKALVAYKYSYGDNKLRVTGLLGDLYQKLGQKDEGIKILDEVISGFPLPEDKNIRSHKYVERLKKIREDLKKGA